MQSLYRVSEVSKILSVSQSTIWRWTKAGLFPKPKKIGGRVTVWTRDSIEEFIASQK